MDVKRSSALVFLTKPGGFIGYNYITKDEFECDPCAIELMSKLDDWTSWRAVVDYGSEYYGLEAEKAVDSLLSVNGLIERDSKQAGLEQEFLDSWEWNLPSAMLHFAVTDRQYLTIEQVEELQQTRKRREGTIALLSTNDEAGSIELRRPDLACQPFATMAARRTERECGKTSIALDHLSDCLFAGLGVTDWTKNSVSRLPLKMTPSGGARNPFEAYVMACQVDRLEPGFYHYSAAQHSLECCESEIGTTPAELLGGQAWAANAAAVIFLCADFRRTMWKYDKDDNAYRVVMIEAGHIGQNIMLVATHHGYSACPSAAISHKLLHDILGIDRLTESAIYALVINKLPTR